MHKSNKHRRTQSNSEVDLKTLCPARPLEVIHIDQNKSDSIREVIVENLEDEVVLQQQKENCGLTFGNSTTKKKRANFGSYQFNNNLFQIPEQNDLMSSIEQTQESGNKHARRQSSGQKGELQHKTSMSLINQIQQIVIYANEYQQQQFGLRDITAKMVNTERVDNAHKMSFTKELQKKKTSVAQVTLKQTITPDRKRVASKGSKDTSQCQRSDKSQVNTSQSRKDIADKLKNNLSVTIFNNLLRQDTKKVKSDDPLKRIESQMKRIEKEIGTIKQRQDLLDEVNKTLQGQLIDFIQDSRKQRDVIYHIYPDQYYFLEEIRVIGVDNKAQ